MKRTVLSFVAAVGILGASAPALAQLPENFPTAPIAFISGQRIAQETNEGKAGAAKIQAFREQKAADLRAKQQAFSAVRDQIAATTDRATLITLQKQAVDQQAALERANLEAQNELATLQRQLNVDLLDKVRGVLGEMLKGRNVSVLNLDTAAVWVNPVLDLTPQVVARMNGAPAGTSSPAK